MPAEPRPYADPEKAAQRIVEIASTVEPVQDGRIHIELVNGPLAIFSIPLAVGFATG
jgi:hypothetical protein